MTAQVSDLESRTVKWQESLAEAMSWKVHASEQTTQKEVEKKDLYGEFHDMVTQCRINIQTCESEMCALTKIRGEIFKMDSAPTYFVDCQVSNWMQEDCTVDCGGGLQNFTRFVTAQPEYGAACPPLMLEHECNMQQCPVDCEISEWSGWSSCSAKCGGGVR